jgi:hypothetical protein
MDDRSTSVDLATIIAMAAICYTVANTLHEGLGHGGACVLVGGHPTVLNAIFFDHDDPAAAMWQRRWISAGGTIANLIVGLPLAWLLRRGKPANPSLRYCLWLFCAVNLLDGFGYLLFSGIGGIGDWADFVKGLGYPLLLRGSMAMIGAVLYFVVAPRILMPPLEPFLGKDPVTRATRSRQLCLFPYLAGGVSLVSAGLLNPYGMQLVLISAVATGFGGTSLLAWYFGIPRKLGAGALEIPLAIPRSGPWIVAGVLVLLFFVFVLGPGIRL